MASQQDRANLLESINSLKPNAFESLIPRRIALQDTHGNRLFPYAHPADILQAFADILLIWADEKTNQDFMNAFLTEYSRRRADSNDPHKDVKHIIAQDIERASVSLGREEPLKDPTTASASDSNVVNTARAVQSAAASGSSGEVDDSGERNGASSNGTTSSPAAGAAGASDVLIGPDSAVEGIASTSNAEVPLHEDSDGSGGNAGQENEEDIIDYGDHSEPLIDPSDDTARNGAELNVADVESQGAAGRQEQYTSQMYSTEDAQKEEIFDEDMAGERDGEDPLQEILATIASVIPGDPEQLSDADILVDGMNFAQKWHGKHNPKTLRGALRAAARTRQKTLGANAPIPVDLDGSDIKVADERLKMIAPTVDQTSSVDHAVSDDAASEVDITSAANANIAEGPHEGVAAVSNDAGQGHHDPTDPDPSSACSASGEAGSASSQQSVDSHAPSDSHTNVDMAEALHIGDSHAESDHDHIPDNILQATPPQPVPAQAGNIAAMGSEHERQGIQEAAGHGLGGASQNHLPFPEEATLPNVTSNQPGSYGLSYMADVASNGLASSTSAAQSDGISSRDLNVLVEPTPSQELRVESMGATGAGSASVDVLDDSSASSEAAANHTAVTMVEITMSAYCVISMPTARPRSMGSKMRRVKKQVRPRRQAKVAARQQIFDLGLAWVRFKYALATMGHFATLYNRGQGIYKPSLVIEGFEVSYQHDDYYGGLVPSDMKAHFRLNKSKYLLDGLTGHPDVTARAQQDVLNVESKWCSVFDALTNYRRASLLAGRKTRLHTNFSFIVHHDETGLEHWQWCWVSPVSGSQVKNHPCWQLPALRPNALPVVHVVPETLDPAQPTDWTYAGHRNVLGSQIFFDNLDIDNEYYRNTHLDLHCRSLTDTLIKLRKILNKILREYHKVHPGIPRIAGLVMKSRGKFESLGFRVQPGLKPLAWRPGMFLPRRPFSNIRVLETRLDNRYQHHLTGLTSGLKSHAAKTRKLGHSGTGYNVIQFGYENISQDGGFRSRRVPTIRQLKLCRL
ncbi:hypothetical protein CLAFUR4_05297 [Fulvia fulva]|nr:hypothetical protein CLAFUR4_05297 [Fulvia fulva]